jgi:hypothetical protein
MTAESVSIAAIARLVVEGGAGLVALYVLAGLKGELGQIRGILETLVKVQSK